MRAELERILASEIFSRSDRLSAFLRFIVEQTLNGGGEMLKEQVIAIEVYGKGTDFNPSADPIVRVDARRLRDRLREYYESAPHGSVVITVPKGSYTPVFMVDARSGEPPSVTEAPARRRSRRPLLIAGAVLCLTVAAVWIAGALRARTESASPLRLLPITSHPGAEEDPALSPDGNVVAYSWQQGTVENADLWVKPIGNDAARQLTDTPDVSEKWPQWSPDGQSIAYTALLTGRPPSVFRISPYGGARGLIAESAAQATWTPDGTSIVMVRVRDGSYSLVEHVLATGAQRTLVSPPSGFRDIAPRVSPDGRRLAFVRSGSARSAVFVMAMQGGEPKRLGNWSNGYIGGVSWTPDGRDLLAALPDLSGRRLVRLDANGVGSAAAVPGLPPETVAPAVSRMPGTSGHRLAFVSGYPDLSLRLIDLRAPVDGGDITAVKTFCDATRVDQPGRFSPDGTLVAFTSDRGGNQQVWIVGRDESLLRSVTHLPDATVNVGGWSPDGRWVAFDAAIGDKTAIYRVSVDGTLQQLANDSDTNSDPEWSRDGAWIYYASTATGRSEIWKIPAAGGPRVQLTFDGGFEPRASPDGRSIYFVDRPRSLPLLPATLKRVPIEGGPSSVVYAGVTSGSWDLADVGVVFVQTDAGSGPRARNHLAVLETATGRVRQLGALPFRVSPALATRRLMVSRDGNWAIASHIDRWERDIMLLDNFR